MASRASSQPPMSSPEPGSPRQPRAWIFRVVFLASLAWFAWGAWSVRRLAIDDAYITYRFAWRLAHDGNLQWNRGEAPVEGYTSFLAVVISAVFERAGIRPILAWKAMGIGLALGAAGFAAWGAAILLGRFLVPARRAGLPWLAAALWLANPVVAAHAMSGMETMLFAFLLTMTTALALRIALSPPPARRALLSLAVCFLLLGMARPEGVLWSLLCIAAIWPALSRISRRDFAAALLLGFFLPGAVYFVSRWVYFGDLLPATFHAKAGGAPSPLGRLHTYLPSHWAVWRYVRQNWLCMGVVGAAGIGLVEVRRLADSRQPGTALWAPAGLLLASLACLAFFSAMHIEIMGYCDRFLFPFGQTLWVLVFAPTVGAIIVFVASPRWRQAHWRRAGLALATVAVCALIACGARMLPVWQRRYRDTQGLAQSNSTIYMPYRHVGRTLDELAARAGRQMRIFHHNMGILMYFAPRFDSIDPVGLVDRHVAHHGFSVDYLYSRNPDILLLPSKKADRITTYRAELTPDVSAVVVNDPRIQRYKYLGYEPHIIFGAEGRMHFFVRRDILRWLPCAVHELESKLNLRRHPNFADDKTQPAP